MISGRYTRSKITDFARLNGATIDQLIVKGKLLVLMLRDTESFSILSTLGMTGWWYRMSWTTALKKHARVVLELDDGSLLVYCDSRNFGTFKVTTLEAANTKLGSLGPDIMTPESRWPPALQEFLTRVHRFAKKQTVAEGLMDQRIVAGVGNYIRADALYLATMSPLRPMQSLSEQELNKLWRAAHIISMAAYDDTHPIEADRGFDCLCYAKKLSPKNEPIEAFVDKNKRTVWWCPSEQV